MEPLVSNYRPRIVLFCITPHFSGTVDGTMQGLPVVQNGSCGDAQSKMGTQKKVRMNSR